MAKKKQKSQTGQSKDQSRGPSGQEDQGKQSGSASEGTRERRPDGMPQGLSQHSPGGRRGKRFGHN